MESLFLTGPKEGHQASVSWKGIKAKEEEGNIFLSLEDEDFLKITICPDR